MSICSKFAHVTARFTTLSADAQAILESMGDAFYALDVDWRFVYANRRALAFWNTTADEVIGQVIWQRFPQMVGSLNEQVLRRVRDEQRMITFEAPSPTTGVWVSVNVGPSGDGVTVYWRDISQRIEAENALRSFAGKLEREVAERTRVLHEVVAELRRSRARYSAIFEHSPVDLVVQAVQPDGRLVCEDANPAWERHSGYPRDFVVGRSLQEILPPSRRNSPPCSTAGRSRPESRLNTSTARSSRSAKCRVARFWCPCRGRVDASSMCCWPPST